MIASARCMRSFACAPGALARDDLGLAQEALDAVVEHHDELRRATPSARGSRGTPEGWRRWSSAFLRRDVRDRSDAR